MIRRVIAALAVSTALTATAQAGPTPDSDTLARTFDAAISSDDQMAWLKQMSSEPNQVGSPHDKANAEFMLAQFKSWGWDAHIETFQVLYPTPISTIVEMTAPDHIVLGGQEPPVAGDPTSGNTAGALPPYLAYQGDGDVTGDLVYVNYGMPDDYEALARRGISVKGKIVIARYGAGWRGLKPKLAEQHGAIGCIIYSDPQDDGYRDDDVYPAGGGRPPEGIQRGSVEDMITYPGDPLTPGVGAVEGAKRIDRANSNVLHIPALPMDYADAVKLLQRLHGPKAPSGWQGALPITYHIGGDGGVSVHLAVKSDWSLKPIYDVIAMIRGAKYPDQWVIRGNHHDGWVFGADDPLSGNVALMDEAKAFGALMKTGWRPDRTIVYASWDGEEPGLLGSTEWAETHADELKAKGVIYINTDNNARGVLYAEGSHDYQHFVNQVAADVTDPETGVSIGERARAYVLASAYDGARMPENIVKAAASGADMPIGAMGSGSDYSAFLQHLGLPALNIGFGGEGNNGGAYHSVYDSYHHVMSFDDPGLKYGAVLARTVGRLVMGVADADTPPVRYGDVADTVAGYLDQVKKLADDQRAQDEKRARLLDMHAFKLASDPLAPVGPPPAEAATPHLDLAPLENAVDALKHSATAYDAAYAAHGADLSPARREKLNAMLLTADQLLLDDRGLPGRPWYRDLITAPGALTGYGAKTLPGVREAIEDRRFDDANTYAARTADALNAYAARLDSARKLVEGD